MRTSLLTLMLAATLLAGCGSKQKSETVEERHVSLDSVPMLIMQVQRCSRVYTAEYRIHKIVTHDDQPMLRGSILSRDFNIPLPLGDRKIAIPMDATLKAYVDFADFSEENVVRDGERITIYLPAPKVIMTSSKIDQNNIKSYVGLVRHNFSDAEMTSYEQQGRASIIQSIPRLGIIETAKEGAANLLIPMVEKMGYKRENITITFGKKFGESDIKTLLDPETFRKMQPK